MGRYIIRRLLGIIITLFGVSVIVFCLTYVLPGDPARSIAGPKATIETVDSVRRQLGLDQPLPVQYLRFLSRAVVGDLGTSWRMHEGVFTLILNRLPATAQLAVASIFLELVIGLTMGTISALRQYGIVDRIVMVSSFLFLSVPGFWLGLLMLYFFGFQLRWFPLGGYGTFNHLVLPALTVGLMYSPWYARLFRSSLLEVFKSDYLVTARAKGLTSRTIFLRHALPNAIRPMVTMTGMDLASFLGGVVVIEIVFGWPGIGLQAWDAIQFLDIPLIMGTVLFASFLVVVMNLIVDLSYILFDPRVVYQ